MNADQIAGELVHIEMRRRRISQAELGEVLGISQAAAGRKLYGTRSWTLDELLATARFLNVNVADLMPGHDYAPAPAGRGRVNAGTVPTEVETVPTMRAPRDSNPQPSDP